MRDDKMQDLSDFLKDQITILQNVARIKPTHCFDIARKVMEVVPVTELHYTAFGIRAEIMWDDGQKYELEIRPIREEKECPE